MKIKMNSQEIEIKAKGLYNNNRTNNKDLIAILNELSIVYGDAAKYNAELGYDGFAADFQSKADILYKICDELGAYN